MSLYSDLDKCSGKFYNIKRLLTYGKPWMFVTGSRSIGKSTSVAVWAILNFLETGQKFIYCRRTQDETLLTAPRFFGNAVQIINERTDRRKIKSVWYNRKKYYIVYDGGTGDDADDERIECGMIIPLSLEYKYKSDDLSKYSIIIYDEFIAKNTSQYLGSSQTPDREYTAMISLYQTVDRGIDRPYRNETRVVFLGNTATIYNPLFLSMGIADYVTRSPEAKIISPKGELWVLERIESVDALSDISQSWAYQLANKEERAYAYENKGVESLDNSFIGKPDISFYDETFTLDGVDYGISHNRDGMYYIGKPHYKATMKRYSLDVKGHDGVDLKLIHRMMDHPLIMWVHDAYLSGRLYFRDAGVKQAWLKYLQYMP